MARRRGRVAFAAALALFLVAASVSIERSDALFEDQAGEHDWVKALAGGLLRQVLIVRDAPKHAFVSTGNGLHGGSLGGNGAAPPPATVASVNTRTGNIKWRQDLPASEGAPVLHGGAGVKLIVAVSDGGRRVRAFSRDKGVMMWTEQTTDPILGVAFVPTGGRFHAVVLLRTHRVEARSGSDGGVRWSSETFVDSAYWGGGFPMLHANQETGDVTAVMRSESGVTAHAWNPSSGKTLRTATGAVTGETGIVTETGVLAVFDAATHTLKTAALGGSKLSFSSVTVEGGARTAILPLGLASSVAVGDERGGSTFVYTVNPSSGKASLANTLSTPSGTLVTGYALDASTDYVAAVNVGADGTAVRAEQVGGGEIASTTVALIGTATHGGGLIAALRVVKTKSGKISPRLVVQTDDLTVSHVRADTGAVSWARDEALAHISAAVFTDLPPGDVSEFRAVSHALGIALEDDDEAGSGTPGGVPVVGPLVSRIQFQITGLVDWAVGLVSGGGSGRRNAGRDGDDDTSATTAASSYSRDKFDFHQLIFAVTDVNRVVGLRTEDGSVAWSTYLAPAEISAPFHVLPLKSSTHPHPEFAVIGAVPSRQGASLAVFIDPATGAELRREVLLFNVASTFATGAQTEDARAIYGVIGTDHQIRYLPTEGAAQFASSSVYFHALDDRTGTLSGYKSSATAATTEVWTMSFNPAVEQVVAMATPAADDKSAEAIRKMGNENIRYKYLNPNLLAIATEENADGQASTTLTGKPALPTVHIYLVDSVSGRVLFHTKHDRSRGPVQMIVVANSVVYQLWNIKEARWEVHVVDLYDSQSDTKDRHTVTFSSWDRPKPDVERNAFVFPTQVTVMAATKTLHSITGKQFLFGLKTSGVYGLDRRWLDGARMRDEKAAKALGVVPYSPFLPLALTSVMNYNQTVAAIRGIEAAATRLESTSLVFAYGLDLFFTRASPSQAFDVLNADFQYELLGIVFVGLVVGLFVVRSYANNKALKASWK